MNDSDIRDLAARLRECVRGEVRFDPSSRVLYSTDASIYQIEPIGVVVPREPEDVLATFEVARTFGVPILPRGAGTSLAGQTVGRALVIDASKHLNRILAVSEDEGWALVEPGVVQEHLNQHLWPLGYLFGPDTATASRATLGGMIGNNSAGAHSIVYGKTVDHVICTDTVLASGEEERFGATEFSRALNDGGIAGRVARIAGNNREEVERRFPRILRRVSGYNLDELVRNDTFNLSKIIVGSEGTLAWVARARVRIVPRPPSTGLMIVHFRSVSEAVEATEAILPLGPAAIELVDDMILGLARNSLGISRELGFLEGSPGALLIVEFFGETTAAIESDLDRLRSTLRRERMGYAWPTALDPEQQARVWNMRRAGLGLLLGIQGDRKPIAFVEDCAVETARLPEFFQKFRTIVDGFDTRAGYYGHASVGCLHIRPLIDTRLPSEVRKMREMMDAVVDLVIEFGGAMSGEHGDGLARSHLNERLFGRQIYSAFQAVKHAFDPEDRMNPGKIVDGPAMDQDLRNDAVKSIDVRTHYRFSNPGGMAGAAELCTGIGVCRKTEEGTMCPSYMVTHEEMHSTRGRANLMRAVLTGKLPIRELSGQMLHAALDLCLECKACKAECPTGVDMAKLKYEFLAGYNEVHRPPLRSRMFANVHSLNAAATAWPAAANWLAESRAVRWAADRWLGIERGRQLPKLSAVTFEHWFRNRPRREDVRPPTGRVVLFHDTFMSFNHPEVGQAATILLEAAGYEVILANRTCCGRPMISKGFPEMARMSAAHNAQELGRWIDRGYVVVGCEPSCVLTFRDEYPDLIGSAAEPLAASSFLLEEFIEHETSVGRWRLQFERSERPALLHTHCHQKALTGSRALAALLGNAYDITEIDSGCCGMAGAFGYEKEHYALSQSLARRHLIPQIQHDDALVVASGESCRQQILDESGRRALAPAEALLRAIAPASVS